MIDAIGTPGNRVVSSPGGWHLPRRNLGAETLLGPLALGRFVSKRLGIGFESSDLRLQLGHPAEARRGRGAEGDALLETVKNESSDRYHLDLECTHPHLHRSQVHNHCAGIQANAGRGIIHLQRWIWLFVGSLMAP